MIQSKNQNSLEIMISTFPKFCSYLEKQGLNYILKDAQFGKIKDTYIIIGDSGVSIELIAHFHERGKSPKSKEACITGIYETKVELGYDYTLHERVDAFPEIDFP